MRLRVGILVLLTAAALVGCAGEGPPRQLAGRWSRGAAACDAGIGLEFGKHGVDAVYGGERERLLAEPRYQSGWEAGRYLVRIRYAAPNGRRAGARGELVLERRDDGWLVPVAHRTENAWTGAQRMRLGRDPFLLQLMVRPCKRTDWIAGLRGR